MSFKIYGALFKQTVEQLKQRLGDRYDASKNYPDYNGNIDVAADEATALADYIMGATPDENGKIRIPMSGWLKEARSGVKYLSLQISPPREAAKSAPADFDSPF